MRLRNLLLVFLGLFSSNLAAREAEAPLDRVLGMAYTARLFYDVDVNDALAATRVWIDKIVRDTGAAEESSAMVVDNLDDLEGLLATEVVDVIGMLPLEFLQIRDRVPLVPVFIGSVGDTPTYEYALYVRRDSGIQHLRQLRGASLLIEKGGKGSLAGIWLQTLVMKQTGKPVGFLGTLREVDKISQAVLPVFFGNADACVAPVSTFDTMAELNPQLTRQIERIAVSPVLSRGPVCFRNDVLEEFGDVLVDALGSLHTDPRGQQILTLFHLDRLLPFEEGHLDGVRALMSEYRSLKFGEGTRDIPNPDLLER